MAPRGPTLILALGIAACAARQPRDTLDDALGAASRAMVGGDAPTLIAMLDERLVVGMTPESLAGDMMRDAAEFAELGAMLSRPEKVDFKATIETGGGQKLELVLEDDGWKLATPVKAASTAKDPIQALALLADELDSLRGELAESGLLAKTHEKGFLAMLETLASEVRQVRPEDLVLAEDRCYCNLPSGRKIELVREDDTWKVFSIFPPIEFR
jgi:hypothetical protein